MLKFMEKFLVLFKDQYKVVRFLNFPPEVIDLRNIGNSKYKLSSVFVSLLFPKKALLQFPDGESLGDFTLGW